MTTITKKTNNSERIEHTAGVDLNGVAGKALQEYTSHALKGQGIIIDSPWTQ